MILDLGIVHHPQELGSTRLTSALVWTAPQQLAIPPGVVKIGENQLQVEVTNVGPTGSLGDEQEPDDGASGCPGTREARFLKWFRIGFWKANPTLFGKVFLPPGTILPGIHLAVQVCSDR